MKRVGIYAGVFDPVHAGHIASALQAIEHAKLDKVIFLPERRPRNKAGVEHFGHRVAMLNRAVRPHRKLSVLELVDTSFSVKRTLTQLKRLYPDARLVFLWGSDTVAGIPAWPDADKLLRESEFVVIKRDSTSQYELNTAIKAWPHQPIALHVFDSYAGHVSSHSIREALRRRRHHHGLLKSVAKYANQNWLYVAFS